MIRKYRKLLFLCAFLCFGGNGNAQNVALKTNALYWGATTPNASVEIGLSRKFTTDWQLHTILGRLGMTERCVSGLCNQN